MSGQQPARGSTASTESTDAMLIPPPVDTTEALTIRLDSGRSRQIALRWPACLLLIGVVIALGVSLLDSRGSPTNDIHMSVGRPRLSRGLAHTRPAYATRAPARWPRQHSGNDVEYQPKVSPVESHLPGGSTPEGWASQSSVPAHPARSTAPSPGPTVAPGAFSYLGR
jgi:hypothetical protein